MTTNYSILIVDDEDDYREMFSLILKDQDYVIFSFLISIKLFLEIVLQTFFEIASHNKL